MAAELTGADLRLADAWLSVPGLESAVLAPDHIFQPFREASHA
ncbi:hypothetical protein [Rhizobium halophytocola]|nr:hypothetical protein [Rhizobium halophytocola]